MSGILAAIATLLLVSAVVTPAAQAETFNVVYTFTGDKDGANPFAGVTLDKGGNLYGTTSTGGEHGYGTVFELKHVGSSWIVIPLYSFEGGNDGVGPRARVVFGPDGTLYGTTFHGGGTGCAGQGCGIVFNLRPAPQVCKTALCPWKETVLYRFTGATDGGQPLGDLSFDQQGNVYGATQLGGLPHGCGGNGCGVVYQISRSGGSWTETVLYQFAGSGDGTFPNGGVVFDHSGNLFGTTVAGGSRNFGTVFQLTSSGSSWTEKIIYNFQNSQDGFEPDSGLMFDAVGNLYGSTLLGGSGAGGTVFQLEPSNGEWTFNLLYSLVGTAGPIGSLSMDAAGNLYGTTYQDGAYRLGSGFKLSPAGGGWTGTSLHDFTGGKDGSFPQSTLVFDAKGNLYGTSAYGGANGDGVVVEITP